MEQLWSQAGATSGNLWQMGRARKPLKQADQQAIATHGNRFTAHGKEHVCHRLPPVAEDPLLVREGVGFRATQRDEPREPEGPQDSTENLTEVDRCRFVHIFAHFPTNHECVFA